LKLIYRKNQLLICVKWLLGHFGQYDARYTTIKNCAWSFLWNCDPNKSCKSHRFDHDLEQLKTILPLRMTKKQKNIELQF